MIYTLIDSSSWPVGGIAQLLSKRAFTKWKKTEQNEIIQFQAHQRDFNLWKKVKGHYLPSGVPDPKQPRALSICQNWPAKSFPTQWEFPFQSNLSSQISQILRSMHQGNGCLAKTLGKSVFHYQTDWSGNGPAGQFWQMESAPRLARDEGKACVCYP